MSHYSPITNTIDSVFPGEGWFLYWKTASSLWKSKLEEIKTPYILIPINWAFHTDTGDQIDFGETRPEANLKRLVDEAQEQSKNILFFLPTGPCPFLPNSGVPSFLARSLSRNHEKMIPTILDNRGNISKIYSFFDTRIFKGYCRFVKELGKYFNEHKINSSVYGFLPGHMRNGEFNSYFSDQSEIFMNTFAGFLDSRRPKNITDSFIKKPQDEYELQAEFTDLIKNLYLEAASEALSKNWEEEVKVAFLGGDPLDFFSRIYGREDGPKYSHEVLDSLKDDIIPSGLLLASAAKEGALKKQLDDFVWSTSYPIKFQKSLYRDDELIHFRPLIFFEFLEFEKNYKESFKDLGIFNYLNAEFKWNFSKRKFKDINVSLNEANELDGKILFLIGEELQEEHFFKVIKMFMNGGKIILDTYHMNDSIQRKLENFFLENSLKVEKVNYVAEVSRISLGDSVLILFNSDHLLKNKLKERISFWEKILSTFSIVHPKIDSSENIVSFWRRKNVVPMELQYDEIRRVNFLNPTSYKAKVNMEIKNNFMLLKIVEQERVKIQTRPHEISLELLPGATLSIDFGIYS